MARDLEPGRKLARHRGSFLEGPTGSTRARQQGLSGGVHEELDEQHAARQAHGRAFTRLAGRARSKARARASSVSFGQAPTWVASAVEPAPRRHFGRGGVRISGGPTGHARGRDGRPRAVGPCDTRGTVTRQRRPAPGRRYAARLQAGGGGSWAARRLKNHPLGNTRSHEKITGRVSRCRNIE
jgi:hypothetical protein